MATVPTLSSSPFVNVTLLKLEPISSTLSLSLRSLHLRHYHCNHRAAPICRAQSRRRYRGFDEHFFDGYGVLTEEDEISDDEEDETESSVDLLIRFLRSMFKKVSKRAKKASRSILPVAISPQLVSFAVDGILLLASLSIVKAFLEVICNLGGTVFAVILLLRLIWTTASYFQPNGSGFNQHGRSFGATQPVA